jgi:hypothetical protein
MKIRKKDTKKVFAGRATKGSTRAPVGHGPQKRSGSPKKKERKK